MKNQMTIDTHTMVSPVGDLRLFATDTALIGLYMKKEKQGPRHSLLEKALPRKTELLGEAERQLKAYFAGDLKKFSLPLEFIGTEFQKAVWLELLSIELGELRIYSEHAKKSATEKAVRAVGTAIGSNPISIIAPCHRVIGKSGGLTGYAGGVDVKAWLLKHEGHKIKNQSVISTRQLPLGGEIDF